MTVLFRGSPRSSMMRFWLHVEVHDNISVDAFDEAIYAVIKTHKCHSNKIYNTELTMTKILN